MAQLGTQDTARTSDFTLTRDELIELAHKLIGVLQPGQVLDGDMQKDAEKLLGLIVRETDGAGRWRWTVPQPAHVPLVANTFHYTTANGLPANIAELVTVCYRNATGQDSAPLKILKAEGYEELVDKVRTGDPKYVYLSDDFPLASRLLAVNPMLTAVATQSEVNGTEDQTVYRCILPHTSDVTTRPTTGANWRLYWEAGGTNPSDWAADTDYTSPQLLRLLYRRPIYDFDNADDAPDFPIQWPRLMVYKLCFDLGDLYGIPVEERSLMVNKAKGAFEDIFPSTKAKSNTVHNKARYF